MTTNTQPFITDAELQKVFLKGFKTICGLHYPQDQETIVLGHVLPIEMPLVAVKFAQEWYDAVEKKLERLDPDSTLYADWFSLQIITYDQFRQVLETSFSEEKIARIPAYNTLYVDDPISLEKYKAKYSNAEESMRARYLRALADLTEVEIPVMHEFLCKQKIPLEYPVDAFKKHSYLVCQSSFGKSEFKKHLFHELAQTHTSKKTLILLEPHFDLTSELVSLRALWKKAGKKLVYLDPALSQTEAMLTDSEQDQNEYTFSINPFDIAEGQEYTIPYLVEELSHAFFNIINSDETFQMEALIEAAVETLLRRPDSDITDLKRFMDDSNNEDLVQFAINNLEGERLDIMKHRFMNDGKLQTTKSSIYYRLQSILGKKEFLQCLTGKRTCDIQHIMDSGGILLCNFQKSALGPEGGPLLGKIFIALLSGYATLRQKQKKSDRVDTYVFIDEFQNYINPGTTEKLFSEQRKYATYFFVSNQQMGQSMSGEIKRLIGGNTSLKFMGPNESDTVEWFSKQFKKIPNDAVFNLALYSFWFYDRYNGTLGSFILRSPSHLVDKTGRHYLNKEELKAAFRFLKHQSGIYRKMESPERSQSDSSSLNHPFTE